MPSPLVKYLRRARQHWPWLAGGLCLAVLVFPLALDGQLRGRAAQRHLAAGWNPDYAMLPLMSLARAELQAGDLAAARRALDRAWPLMEGFRGPFPERLWLGLTWLEATAGRPDRARAALARARELSRDISFMAQAPAFDPHRRELGLEARP